MTIDITVPVLGESVTEATVMRWHKAPGEAVALDETLVELETDKIAVEVKAESAGALAEIVAGEGADVEVGALLGRLEPGAAASTAAAEPVARESSDAQEAHASRRTVPTRAAARVPPPSPAVRHLLEEHGLDPTQIEGTGKGGRLLKSDVLGAVVARASSAAAPEPEPPSEPAQPETSPAVASPPKPAPATVPAPDSSAARETVPAPAAAEQRREERVPMSRLRRRAAERLKLAQDTAAMLTTFNEVDTSAVQALRAKHGEAFEKRHGVRLGFMSFFVKASVAALVEYPAVNAQIDGDDIVYKHYHDIGVAVSAPQGLVVPVLRDAAQMSFAEVEQAIRTLGIKARDGKLALDDLLGGTFTISNGGVFGSLMSTPIITPPQSAILGMHKVEERPVAVAGAVVTRPMMYLALSYDHRIIDGREAVSFLVRIKECIEDPQRLLLDL
ncbi:MAG: 2-oxoglutarate dehydrogenase complex dihydrolipoyllysine-residue succinyltransferase [Rhodospirillales bacterium]|nr:2-oxoglutarate dehydrogenase complex dihydrolipoyllysine-residue succinyltransferase [Rhodospirillales bacterium]